MTSDHDLIQLATEVAARLLRSKRTLVTAESCTGGWIGKVLTDLPGSSGWFSGGVITYSNELKTQLLDVSSATLAAHGAVSEQTARAMAVGAQRNLGSDIAVAVTGIAGPGGGSADKPVGTVWFGWAWRTAVEVKALTALENFSGDREAVRRQTVVRALQGVLAIS